MAFLRGEALYTAAEATFRIFYLPWQLRRVIQNPRRAKRAVVINVAWKYTALELGCVLCRYVVSAVGASCSLCDRSSSVYLCSPEYSFVCTPDMRTKCTNILQFTVS